MEIDRVLRPGGYWVLSGPPIQWKMHWQGWERTKEDLNSEQTRIETLAEDLCWKKIIEKGDIAIWQKPINHKNCKNIIKKVRTNPPLCTSPLPSDEACYPKALKSYVKVALTKWPYRLNAIPPRIISGSIKGVTQEMFQKDIKLWKKRVSYYKIIMNHQLGQAGWNRNLLDMNAKLGGFAAALVEEPLWVMNVVPVEAKVNTLGVIYERGLIGTYQSW